MSLLLSNDRLVFGIPEAARILGISRETLRQAVIRGEVPARRLGRQWLIPVAVLDSYAGADTSASVAPPAA